MYSLFTSKCKACGESHRIGIRNASRGETEYSFQCPEKGIPVYFKIPALEPAKTLVEKLPTDCIEATLQD